MRKKMNNLLSKYIGIISALTLAGCVTTPIIVKVSDDKTPSLFGQAAATIVNGTFKVSNVDGLSCSGKYNPWNQMQTLNVKIDCTDGRYGEAIIIRYGANLNNGSGEGKLNDGTRFKIFIGDSTHETYEQGADKLIK